jgi:ABC-type transport system substrate-binding protein
LTLTPDIRGIPSEVEICEVVGSMWENIGLDVNLNKVAYEVIGPKITSRQYDQINCHGTTGRPEPIVLWSVVATSDAGWTMGFDHPWLDEKLKQAVATVDQEARAQIMDEVGRWGFDNAMTAGLFTINILWPLGPDVDSWGDHVEYGDRRMLSSSEWAPHK